VKLAATLCVAALSLTGCLDDTSTGGGHMEGMRPAKPSLDNPSNSPLPANPDIFEGMNQRASIRMPELSTDGVWAEAIKPPVPMEGVCDDCEVIAFHITNKDTSALEEIRVFSDGGTYLCRITFDQDQVTIDSCRWYR
jgi:hypothetical protein